MAGSVNKVILIGNLGQDPEIVDGKNGKFCTLSIATSESWRDKETGERKEVTDWHRVKIFNENLVKFAEDYLRKGHKVYVEGKQKTRTYEKEGQTHYATEVVLANFGAVLISLTKREGDGQRGDSPDDYGTPSGGPRRVAVGNAGRVSNDIDDDIPF
jgi:single-strand DNA-binding protein